MLYTPIIEMLNYGGGGNEVITLRSFLTLKEAVAERNRYIAVELKDNKFFNRIKKV